MAHKLSQTNPPRKNKQSEEKRTYATSFLDTFRGQGSLSSKKTASKANQSISKSKQLKGRGKKPQLVRGILNTQSKEKANQLKASELVMRIGLSIEISY